MHFTSGLALFAAAMIPFLFRCPKTGRTLLQPLWVEDLATCLLWALDNETTRDQTIMRLAVLSTSPSGEIL